MKISMPDNESGLYSADQSALFMARRNRLRGMIIGKGLDALVVSAPPNRFYLSGFELHDPQPNESSGLLIVCADGADWLLTDSRYALAAEKIWPKERLYIYKKQAEGLADLLPREASLAGVEAASLSMAFAGRLKALLGRRVFLQPCGGLAEKLREVKDSFEIAALRKSFALNHRMFQWLDRERENLEGMTEAALAWEIERFFRDGGAQELAFPTIAAAGKKGAEPHAVPGSEKLAKGAPLLVDAGCRVDNYCSDQTRTWWIGSRPAAGFTKAMELVREAQKAAIAMMRPGASCAAAYEAAAEVFSRAGCGDAFTHALGHGVGLETHEAPRLSKTSPDILEKGMAVTVEPGLYYPEWGGVRWENTVLVTESGAEIL